MKSIKHIFALLGVFVLGILLSCSANIKQQITQNNEVILPPNLEKVVESGKAATVQIGSLSVEGPAGTGTGFFIRSDLLVTNIHVINRRSFKGALSVARLVDTRTWYTITGVMDSDPVRDLVILKVQKKTGEAEPNILTIGDSDTVKTDDHIITIGNARKGSKYEHGEVSKGTIRRITPHFFHVKAGTLRGGYSGAAILNVQGEVIGIISKGEATGSGYAVPSNHLRSLLKNLPTQATSLEEWREGPLIRFYSTELAVQRGELKSAMKNYDEVIRLTPDFVDAYIQRGNLKDLVRDFEGAIKDYNNAILLGADHAFVYLRRAGAKSDFGDHKRAIKDYNKAIQLKPENAILATIYINRGNTKTVLADYKGAIEDYNKAIQLKPEDLILAVAFINRAEAKNYLGNHNGAIEDCNTVIGLTQKNTILAGVYNELGKAKTAQGDNINGIIDYNKAVRLEPTNPEFHYNRGIANTTLGYNSKAKKDFKNATKFIEEVVNNFELVDDETAFAALRIIPKIRPGLKADIQKALRVLE